MVWNKEKRRHECWHCSSTEHDTGDCPTRNQHFPQRDHGLDDPPTPIGVPRAVPLNDPKVSGCPNCHCPDLMMITVPAISPLLRGGTGDMHYIGCPACPWAGPSITRSNQPPDPAVQRDTIPIRPSSGENEQ